jgi:hypothetical protein
LTIKGSHLDETFLHGIELFIFPFHLQDTYLFVVYLTTLSAAQADYIASHDRLVNKLGRKEAVVA